MRTLETRYALALLDLTQDEAGLEKAAGLLTGDAALWQALNNPCIPGKEKDRVLCRLLEGTAGKELLSFFRLLCARERLALLPAIQGRYHQLKLAAPRRCTAAPASRPPRIWPALRKC